MAIYQSKPKQKRATQTRKKLIDSAITCLARYGYAGAQLGQIADMAGVSRGPRQYYFPSRVSLMIAVWSEIRQRDNTSFKLAIVGADTLAERIDALLNFALVTYKSEQFLADLELKLAVRSDEELATQLTPFIEDREVSIDEYWAEFLKDAQRSNAELIAYRYLIVSLMRGMAIEYLARRDHSNLAELEKQFKHVIREAFVA